MRFDYEETRYGFRFGPVRVERMTSNDGSDKRKQWVALRLYHDNGQVIDVTGTREGIKISELSNREVPTWP